MEKLSTYQKIFCENSGQRKFQLSIILFLFFLISAVVNAQNAVSTLCGTSVQGSPLAGPNGVCISPDGTTLYLADYTANRIKSVNISTHGVTNRAGSGTSGYADGAMATAQFSYPSGIKITSDGLLLYVADNANCLIRKIDLSSGMVSTVAGVYYAFSFLDNADGSLAMFNQPVDLVIAPGDSVLYVSDTENHIIRKINLITTAVSTVAGVPGSFGSTDGAAATAKFRNPKGLALSSNGNLLYIADGGNHKIRVLDIANATVSTLAGSGTPGSDDNVLGSAATFDTPQGVVLLPNDSLLYVMDTYSNRIRAINISSTEVTTVAGTTSTSQSHFTDNTNGLLAKFYHPVNGVLSPSSDKLFISDQENFRVRVVNTDMVVTGLNNISNNAAAVLYPNPASEKIFLKINSQKNSAAEYSILDVSGKELVSRQQLIFRKNEPSEISLANISAGIYFLKLTLPEETIFLKVIKSTINDRF